MFKRLLEPGEEKWKIIPMYYFNKMGCSSLLLNVHTLPEECKQSDWYIPTFYKQLLRSFNTCKNITKVSPVTTSGIRQQIIWGNRWIKYKGKSLWLDKWIKSKIIFINDLYDISGNFNTQLIFENIVDKTNVFAEMFIVKNAIPEAWKNVILNDPCKIQVKYPSMLDVKFFKRNGNLLYFADITSSSELYQILVELNKKSPSAKALWENIFSEKNILWKNVYIEKLYNVKEQKIIAFNFKILNNILATPYKLYKWKMIHTDICHLCFTTGNMEHMMLKCAYFDAYYKHVTLIFSQLGYNNLKMDLYTLICGYKSGIPLYAPLNLVLNIVFFCVYKCWVKIKINRIYKNPITVLYNEMNIRCKSNSYNCDLFNAFANRLEQL